MLTPSLGLGINFSSPRRLEFNFLMKGKKPVLSRLEKYAFIRLFFSAALGFLSIHLSWNSCTISTLLLGNLCQTHGG